MKKEGNYRSGGTRILIATGIYPPEIGGPSRMVGALTGELTKNGFEVKIITYSKNKEINGIDDKIIRVKTGNKLRYFWEMLKLCNWCDLIYVTDTYSPGYFAYIFKKIFRKKYILRFAGDSAWEISSVSGSIHDNLDTFVSKKYNLEIEKLKKRRKRILVNADYVISVSKYLEKIALAIGVDFKKVKTIYNSVEFINKEKLMGESLKLRQKLKLENKKIIMTSGRLIPSKGIEAILRALSNIKIGGKLSDFRLVVIGDGPEREKLIQLAKELNIEKEVIFTGRVDFDKVIYYYNLADVFVLNSQYEGMSHALLEVLGLGKPVGASSEGGNFELINSGDNGILFKYNNQKEIEDAILKMVFENKWRTEEYKKQARKSLEKFSWKENINKTIELIDSL